MEPEIRRLQAEQERVIKEADFAYKQAFAFCPYSPEAVFRYTSLLTSLSRLEDALVLVETGLRFDPDNGAFQQLRDNLQQVVNSNSGNKPQQAKPTAQAPANQSIPLPAAGPKPISDTPSIQQLEQHVAANPDDLQATFNLISSYALVGQTNKVYQILESVVARGNATTNYTALASAAQAYIQLQHTNEALKVIALLMQKPKLDASTLTALAHMNSQLGQVAKLEECLTKLTGALPDNPEAWYDLAAIRAVMGGKQQEALKALSKSVQLSRARLAKDPKAGNMQEMAIKDERFLVLKNTPGFPQALQGTY